MRPISSAIAARRRGIAAVFDSPRAQRGGGLETLQFHEQREDGLHPFPDRGLFLAGALEMLERPFAIRERTLEQGAERSDRLAAPGAGEPGCRAFPGCDGFVETPRGFESACQAGEGLRIFGAEPERPLEALDRGRGIAGCECTLAEFDEPRGRFGPRRETRLARGQLDRFAVVPGRDAGASQAPERRHEGGVQFECAAVGRRGAGGIAQALLDGLPHPKQQSRLLGRSEGRGGGGEVRFVERNQFRPCAGEEELLLEQIEGGAIARVGLETLAKDGARPAAGRIGGTGRVRHGPLTRSRWATGPPFSSSREASA